MSFNSELIVIRLPKPALENSTLLLTLLRQSKEALTDVFCLHQKLYVPSTLNNDLTMGCGCSKVLNHGLNNGLFLSLFGWKYILNSIENSGLNCRLPYCFIFRFYLTYNVICQKPAHFLSTVFPRIVSAETILFWI